MLPSMASESIAHLIDKLLGATPKALDGVPIWRDQGAHDQHRLVLPVTLHGASTGLDLVATAYPNTLPLRFCILLRYEKCILRIDWADSDIHTNPYQIQPDIAGMVLVGPHVHSWADNRRFCTHNSLPINLKAARRLPDEVVDFDTALEWLCREANIEPPPPGLVVLPARTRLL